MTSTPVTVEAGSTGNSTITITPSASFTGTVALQCDFNSLGSANSPCSISPSVAISGTTTPVTVSLAISPGVGTDPGSFVVTVMGTASNGTTMGAPVSVTVPVTVTAGPNFTLSSTPVTIAPGGTGISTLTVTPTLGFTGSVTLSCVPDYVPDQPICTSPAPVTISGTAPVNVSIPVTIDAAAAPGTYGVEVQTLSFPGHLKSTEITVTVAGPAVGPTYTLINTAVNIASPGATGTSTITITPSGGFTGKRLVRVAAKSASEAFDTPSFNGAQSVSNGIAEPQEIRSPGIRRSMSKTAPSKPALAPFITSRLVLVVGRASSPNSESGIAMKTAISSIRQFSSTTRQTRSPADLSSRLANSSGPES